MREYASICVNISIVIVGLRECVVTYFNGVYSLKKHKTVFLKRQKFNFAIEGGSA